MRPFVYIDPQSYQNLATYDYNLLSHLEGQVHYLCSCYYDYYPLPSHVQQHRLFRYNNLQSRLSKAVSYILSYLCIFFLLIWWRPQVIHLQWIRIPFFDIALMKIVKLLTGSRLIFTAHNILPHDTGNRHYAAYHQLYRLADAIIVHSQATKHHLLSVFDIEAKKVAVIEHGLLKPTYNPDMLTAEEPQYEKKYKLSGKTVFSALGYQYYYKGVDVLAEVWATTPELCENDNCILLLVGRNRGVDLSIANGIKNIIVDDRIISNEEFFFLLSHTDVYLLPYRDISQSGVLMTLISTGTPFLVTDVGGLTEPLKLANVGWQMPHLSTDILRKRLLWLMNHPDSISDAKHNEEGWHLLRQHYDWGRIGKQVLNLYIGKDASGKELGME